MAPTAMSLAVAGLIAAMLPSLGLFLAMALGLAAVGTGTVAYQRRHDRGSRRLWGAAAIVVGGVALTLGVVRYSLTLAAVSAVESWLS